MDENSFGFRSSRKSNENHGRGGKLFSILHCASHNSSHKSVNKLYEWLSLIIREGGEAGTRNFPFENSVWSYSEQPKISKYQINRIDYLISSFQASMSTVQCPLSTFYPPFNLNALADCISYSMSIVWCGQLTARHLTRAKNGDKKPGIVDEYILKFRANLRRNVSSPCSCLKIVHSKWNQALSNGNYLWISSSNGGGG